ncbi:MAG: heme biosynthesis HemY N-terminal domain-containing protein [Pseudomonadota bacterium]
MRMIIVILLASVFGYGALRINELYPDNYVKMYLGNYVVEVKVLGLLLIIIGLVIVLYFLLWLARLIWRSPDSLAKWQQRRNRNQADDQFGAGYLSLIKGDWRRAEKQLTTKSEHSHIPYVNYLAAARAAQEQGRVEQRDQYLSEAYAAAPEERLAIGLTKARLHEREGQMEAARATLEDISELGKNNPQYTAMLVQIHQQSNNWQEIQQLLPLAKKQRALPEAMLVELQDSFYANSLTEAGDIQSAWKALPRPQRKRLENIAIYVKGLVAKGEDASAEKLIRSALGTDWSDALVDTYGRLNVEKPQKLLRRIEGWLMARPENPHLNLAAGRLAKSAKMLEEAKSYLQTAISQGRLPAAYSVLGEVYEAENQSGKALQMYRVGMQALSSSTLPQVSDKAADKTDDKAEKMPRLKGEKDETETAVNMPVVSKEA